MIKDGKRLAQNDILHLWANNLLTKEVKTRGYIFRPNLELIDRKNDKLLVSKYADYTFVREFDNTGINGKGLSNYRIKSAIPKNITKGTILINNYNSTDITDINVLIRLLIHKIQLELDFLGYYNEAINNNRVISIYNYFKYKDKLLNNKYNNEIECLLDIIYNHKDYNDDFNKEYTFQFEYKKYYGWGSNNYNLYTYSYTTTINKLIKTKTFGFTKKQWSIIKEKQFLYNYYTNIFKEQRKGDINYYRAIYRDPIKRKEFIKLKKQEKKEFIKFERQRIKEQKIIDKEKKLNNIKKFLLNIHKFRSNESDLTLYNQFSYLKLVNNEVITSMGISMSLPKAKIVYDIFKGRRNDKQIDHWNFNGIKKYKVPRLVNDKIVYRSEKCITIGCHTIPSSEIKEFIKYYNLKWK